MALLPLCPYHVTFHLDLYHSSGGIPPRAPPSFERTHTILLWWVSATGAIVFLQPLMWTSGKKYFDTAVCFIWYSKSPFWSVICVKPGGYRSRTIHIHLLPLQFREELSRNSILGIFHKRTYRWTTVLRLWFGLVFWRVCFACNGIRVSLWLCCTNTASNKELKFESVTSRWCSSGGHNEERCYVNSNLPLRHHIRRMVLRPEEIQASSSSKQAVIWIWWQCFCRSLVLVLLISSIYF